MIIMNESDYVCKMSDLLNDVSTYERKYNGYAESETEKFKADATKILKKSNKGKSTKST